MITPLRRQELIEGERIRAELIAKGMKMPEYSHKKRPPSLSRAEILGMAYNGEVPCLEPPPKEGALPTAYPQVIAGKCSGCGKNFCRRRYNGDKGKYCSRGCAARAARQHKAQARLTITTPNHKEKA
jgi:hypothetical protein